MKKCLALSLTYLGFLFMSLIGQADIALAACLANAQCKLDDGSIETRGNENFTSSGPNFNGAALISTNASTIRAKNITATASPTSHYAGYAGAAGTIELTDSTLSGHNGVKIEGSGTNFTMQGGTIDTVSRAIDFYGGVTITLDNVHIKSAGQAINGYAHSSDNHLHLLGGVIEAASVGLQIGNGHFVVDATKITASQTGISLLNNTGFVSNLEMKGGFSIHTTAAFATGLVVTGHTTTKLENGHIEMEGNDAVAIWIFTDHPLQQFEADNVTLITHGTKSHGFRTRNKNNKLSNMDITVNGQGGYGLYGVGAQADIHMTGGQVNVHGKGGAGLTVDNGGEATLDHVTINALGEGSSGVHARNGGTVSVIKNNSAIHATGTNAAALFLFGATGNNDITIEDSDLFSQNHYAIVANGSGLNSYNYLNEINVTNSKIEGDRLIFAGDNGSYGTGIEINANSAQLLGHAEVTTRSRLLMNLNNNSIWTIRPSHSGQTSSTVSMLNLDQSAIIFNSAGTGTYQELWVSHNDPSLFPFAYRGGNGASITLNSFLNEGGAWSNQLTDRLYINGDVIGTTSIIIKEVAGSVGGLTSPDGSYRNDEGISIIQVAGAATENSFVLAGGYVTMGGLPYVYDLYAYGPGSSNGPASSGQQQVTGTDHWDFRLQSQMATFQDNSSSSKDPSSLSRQVVPQLSNYLSTPTALFHAQRLDIGTMRQRLGEIRYQADNETDQNIFFLRAYGGDHHYRSNLVRYGYDADINYTATQLGGHLYSFETSTADVLHAGFAASYGQLAFTPQRENSLETTLNMWSFSPYMTWQGASGVYLDMIAAYGRFDGHVSSALRGRTARLQGYSHTASLEVGKKFALSMPELTIEPQAQLIYQRLSFDATSDIDDFAVELGNPEQWTLRAGLALKKNLVDKTTGKNVTLSGKIDLTHTFDKNTQILLGENFQLGAYGTHLGVGAGVDATFGNKLSLYGDVTWTQRISMAGTSGLGLNGGLKLSF